MSCILKDLMSSFIHLPSLALQFLLSFLHYKCLNLFYQKQTKLIHFRFDVSRMPPSYLPLSFQRQGSWGGGVAQAVECLPRKRNTSSSKPSPARKKKAAAKGLY
jgi:hypothetical protein